MTNTIERIVKVVVSSVMFLGLAVGAAACGNNNSKTDYAHNGSVRLKLDYTGRNFFSDGIGEVTVKTYIDGDTTHFLNVSGDTTTTLKSRYFGIDTPESTGNIQEYGKQASNFTKEKLQNAMDHGTIVVASPFSCALDGGAGDYGVPEADSTGSRYLSMVWINEKVRHAPVESLSLLNLWIVQEGLSWSRIDDDEPFANTFFKAQQQAEKLKLKMWSGKPDPLFNYGDYQTVSLNDIKDEMIEFLVNDHEHTNAYAGAKVRFTGVVAGYSDRTLYVQERYLFNQAGEYVPEDEYDPEHPELYTEKWAGINIFTGMSPINDIFTDVGAYVEVVGKAVDDENFGFQITDTQGKWTDDPEDDESCLLLMSSEQNKGDHALKTFEYTVAELNANLKANNLENLYCRTKINANLVCTDAYVGAAGDEMTLSFEGCDFKVYAPFLYRGDPEDPSVSWMHRDNVVGKTFNVSGVLGYHKTSSDKIEYQIIACNESDLVCLTPREGTVTAEQYSVTEAVENAINAIPNVHYYVTGKVRNVTKIERKEYTPTCEQVTIAEALNIIKGLDDGGATSKKYFVKGIVDDIYENDSGKSITIRDEDNKNKITLYNLEVAEGINESSFGIGDELSAEGKLKKYVNKAGNMTPEVISGKIVNYYSDFVVSFDMYEDYATISVENGRIEVGVTVANMIDGSTISMIGVPQVSEIGDVSYTGVRILDAKLHGQVEDDPLNATEAYNVANKLDKGYRNRTVENYYIEAEVKEIKYAYGVLPTGDEWIDNNNKYSGNDRMCFVVTDGETDFLIWGAKMGVVKDESGEEVTLDPSYVQVGVTVLVTAKLVKNANNKVAEYDGLVSTYYNGCQVIGIID